MLPLAVTGSLMLTGLGVLLLARAQNLGIAALCLGGAASVSTVTRMMDRRALAGIAVPLRERAVPLAVLPAESDHPRRDLWWLPADLPAVVALPAGGWGVVTHQAAVAAVDRVGFDGRWHRIAEPRPVHDADRLISSVGRIPVRGDAVLVDIEWPVPYGVLGQDIRALAEGLRTGTTGSPEVRA